MSLYERIFAISKCRKEIGVERAPPSGVSSERSYIRRLESVRGVELFGARFTRFSYARHSHDTYAFGTVADGAMRFWHGGAEHVTAGDEVIAINPGEVHDGRTGSTSGCRYHMLYVEHAAIEQLFGPDLRGGRLGAVLKGPVLRDPSLARQIRLFSRVLSEPLEQQSAVTQLLHSLFERHGLPPLAVRPPAAERESVKRARSYMTERLGESIHLCDIAAAARISPFHFLRIFKRATGMAPHAYLNQVRLERARLLLQSGASPADVAIAVGFVDQSHLTRRFKSAFGITPSQYRRAQ